MNRTQVLVVRRSSKLVRRLREQAKTLDDFDVTFTDDREALAARFVDQLPDVIILDLTVVVTLQPGELLARGADLLPGVARLANARIPIDGGYRFEFVPSGDCLNAIIAMIDAERQCCRFMRFQLTVEADAGPVRLDVTRLAGTQEFLSGLVAVE